MRSERVFSGMILGMTAARHVVSLYRMRESRFYGV